MKNYYIMFYETVCGKHQELIPLSQIGIDFLLKEAIREKERDNFDRLLKLVNPPVHLFNQKIKINHTFLLKPIYLSRLVTPNFLLYEKYRGPRSKRIIAILKKILNRPNSN
jgi:hypothetical protein